MSPSVNALDFWVFRQSTISTFSLNRLGSTMFAKIDTLFQSLQSKNWYTYYYWLSCHIFNISKIQGLCKTQKYFVRHCFVAKLRAYLRAGATPTSRETEIHVCTNLETITDNIVIYIVRTKYRDRQNSRINVNDLVICIYNTDFKDFYRMTDSNVSQVIARALLL